MDSDQTPPMPDSKELEAEFYRIKIELDEVEVKLNTAIGESEFFQDECGNRQTEAKALLVNPDNVEFKRLVESATLMLERATAEVKTVDRLHDRYCALVYRMHKIYDAISENDT